MLGVAVGSEAVAAAGGRAKAAADAAVVLDVAVVNIRTILTHKELVDPHKRKRRKKRMKRMKKYSSMKHEINEQNMGNK